MSLSRAGSCWRIFGSTHDLFLSVRKLKISSKIGIFHLDIFFPLYFQKKYQFLTQNQSCLEVKLFATKKTEIRVKKLTILVKKNKKKKIEEKKKNYHQIGFSFKLKCPSSSRAPFQLGSDPFQLGLAQISSARYSSAQLGKFQLELITTVHCLCKM